MPVHAFGMQDEEIDVEEELARLDAEGRTIDWDKEDRAEAHGASTCAIFFFVATQTAGMFLILFIVDTWYLLLTLLVDMLYLRMVLSDPGRLAKRNGDPSLLREMERITSRLPEGIQSEQFCQYCRTTRPPRAKHCHKCGVCIAKFDHHCFWLKNCVGAQNHREFLVFVFLLNIWFVVGAFYVWDLLDGENPHYYLAMYVWCAGVGMECFALPLCIGHIYLMFSNTTTVEFARPEKFFYLRGGASNPFSMSLEKNLRRFWGTASRLPPEDYLSVVSAGML